MLCFSFQGAILSKNGSSASVDNTLLDLRNSSYYILRKPNSFIALLFIQNNS